MLVNPQPRITNQHSHPKTQYSQFTDKRNTAGHHACLAALFTHPVRSRSAHFPAASGVNPQPGTTCWGRPEAGRPLWGRRLTSLAVSVRLLPCSVIWPIWSGPRRSSKGPQQKQWSQSPAISSTQARRGGDETGDSGISCPPRTSPAAALTSKAPAQLKKLRGTDSTHSLPVGRSREAEIAPECRSPGATEHTYFLKYAGRRCPRLTTPPEAMRLGVPAGSGCG
ncbi:hypothetical protein NDU88_000081 [Pleurodeles waltl]|uniref:Uncharacterized protein n=1 Tax=Pleurodeles waltl TaxID=8319 RepID=A0AAV7UNZ5_PLEWA|nr:hypothetical protein NDU88_000081 [Pleurodeles waltl]